MEFRKGINDPRKGLFIEIAGFYENISAEILQ